jgi:hypothetical protein
VLNSLFGKAAVTRFYARGDVVSQSDGSVYTIGWDDWQEGDLTVSERVRRTRQKKAAALQNRYADVTDPFPDPLSKPLPPSTVLMSTVLTSESLGETVRESVPSETPLMETIHAIERISGRVWSYRPGSWAWDTLEPDVRDFGMAEVVRVMEAADIKHPDGGQLVKAMHLALHPYGNIKAPKVVEPDRPHFTAEDLRKRRREQAG